MSSLKLNKQELIKIPNLLLNFKLLQKLDLSDNEICRFPGKSFVRDFPYLIFLNLSSNYIHLLLDIQSLGEHKELEVNFILFRI